jgi:predicted HicB family RNase H-like nuclease
MNTMTDRGYAARVEYSEDDGCSVGHAAGIRDVDGFHGESVAELRSAFAEAVDDDLETCLELGREPDHPHSGQFRLQLEPELHAWAAMVAKTQGKSLSAWVSEVIARNVAPT